MQAQPIERARPHNRAVRELTRPQSGPLISRVKNCPTFAGCQQLRAENLGPLIEGQVAGYQGGATLVYTPGWNT